MGHPHQNNSTIGSNKHNDWPNFFRLLSISGLATIATIGNIFTISAIIVDDLLRKKGIFSSKQSQQWAVSCLFNELK
jgi:hypothetical protein